MTLAGVSFASKISKSIHSLSELDMVVSCTQRARRSEPSISMHSSCLADRSFGSCILAPMLPCLATFARAKRHAVQVPRHPSARCQTHLRKLCFSLSSARCQTHLRKLCFSLSSCCFRQKQTMLEGKRLSTSLSGLVPWHLPLCQT